MSKRNSQLMVICIRSHQLWLHNYFCREITTAMNCIASKLIQVTTETRFSMSSPNYIFESVFIKRRSFLYSNHLIPTFFYSIIPLFLFFLSFLYSSHSFTLIIPLVWSSLYSDHSLIPIMHLFYLFHYCESFNIDYSFIPLIPFILIIPLFWSFLYSDNLISFLIIPLFWSLIPVIPLFRSFL